MTLRWPLTPFMLMSHVQLFPRIIVSNSHGNTSKYVDTVTIFQKLNQKVNDPKMTLTTLLLRSHVWLYPRINISKSHENMSKYVDTVTLFFKILNQRSLIPRWPFPPSLLRSHVTQVCGYSDPFFLKPWTKSHWAPRWPLTPYLLRSHVWLYPSITVYKSYGNTSMYVDTVINFAKYHIHTTCTRTYTWYIHTTYIMSDHIVSFWTKFRQDKNRDLSTKSQ